MADTLTREWLVECYHYDGTPRFAFGLSSEAEAVNYWLAGEYHFGIVTQVFRPE